MSPSATKDIFPPTGTDGEVPAVKGLKTANPPVANGRANGHVNGHANGNSNGNGVVAGLKEAVKSVLNGSADSVDDAFALNEQFAYTPRKLRIITIGAGFSGLILAHKFQHRFSELQEFVDHTIYEGRHDLGGTWLVNNYPGVQCDVPAHIYAFPFDPNPEWDRFYATGELSKYSDSSGFRTDTDRP
jgi:hypothetical protein